MPATDGKMKESGNPKRVLGNKEVYDSKVKQ
jgi:hypothetical protein